MSPWPTRAPRAGLLSYNRGRLGRLYAGGRWWEGGARDTALGACAFGLVAALPAALNMIARWIGAITRIEGLLRMPFRSAAYWERRYAWGGDSGAGSGGRLSRFKAETVNSLVREHGVASVIEFGCGDGRQVSLADYPAYMGLDVSPTAIKACRALFAGDPSKRFRLLDDWRGDCAELALSLDVIFHLVEDAVFERHMELLVTSATRFVVIHSSDCDTIGRKEPRHIRHRRFSVWMARHAPEWTSIGLIPNPYCGHDERRSFGHFHIYERRSLNDLLGNKTGDPPTAPPRRG